MFENSKIKSEGRIFTFCDSVCWISYSFAMKILKNHSRRYRFKEKNHLGITKHFMLATPDVACGRGQCQTHRVAELIIGFRIRRDRPAQRVNSASASPNGAIIAETVVKYFVPNVVVLNRTSNT